MNISADEWYVTPWHQQRAILDFMEQAEDIPFGFDSSGTGLPSDQRPQVRENVDAGTEVIDLNAMRAELEAERAKRAGRQVTDV